MSETNKPKSIAQIRKDSKKAILDHKVAARAKLAKAKVDSIVEEARGGWVDITEESRQTDDGSDRTVEFSVLERFGWDIGYAWITLHLGGGHVPALALYARRHNNEKANKRVVVTLKDAIGFFADLKAPPKAVVAIINKAREEGQFPVGPQS